MFPAVSPSSKMFSTDSPVGPNSPVVITLRKELKKALLQVADLQQQVQKEKEVAHKAQQRNLIQKERELSGHETTTTTFLQKWSQAAPDETVYVQRKVPVGEVSKEKGVKSQGRKADEIKRLNYNLATVKKALDAEKVASGKWKREMHLQEKVNLEHQKYIKRLENELNTFRRIQAMEDKRETRRRQQALQNEKNERIAKLREAQWHREVDTARTAANCAGLPYVTPRKPDSFYADADETRAANMKKSRGHAEPSEEDFEAEEDDRLLILSSHEDEADEAHMP